MKDELIRSQIHQAVDHHAKQMQPNPFLAQRIINQERTGEPVVKKRLSIGLVLVIVLMLIAVTALAYTVITAVFSPKHFFRFDTSILISLLVVFDATWIPTRNPRCDY